MKTNLLKFIKAIFVYIIPIIGIVNLFGLVNYKYNSIICVLLFIALLLLYKNVYFYQISKKKKIYILLLSILYSLFIVLGTNIDQNYENIIYSFISNKYQVILEIYSIFIFLIPILFKIIMFIEKIACTNNPIKKRKINFLIVFLVILIFWIPYLINYYPGLMSPDSLSQWGQASGVVKLSNHHPIAHTMFIKLFVMIGDLLGNPNYGVALYSFAQMIILDLVFSYLISYMIDKKVNKYIILLFVCFYSLMPVFGIYSVTMWKDILFGAAATLLMLQIYKFTVECEFRLLDKILLFISIIWTCLFRTNGLYAVIALDICFLFFVKNKFKDFLLFMVIPTIISIIIIGPVYNFCGIRKTEFTESVGIPTKQIYGVLYENLPVDYQNIKFLNGLVDLDEALEIYSPFGDHIKGLKSYSNEYLEMHKMEFFKVWISIGLEYPTKYIDIYLKSTYGYWYPEAQGYIAHKWIIADNNFELRSSNEFDRLKLNGYFEWFYNMPVLKYLTSDGFCFWVLLLILAITIINKSYIRVYSLLLPIFIWGTLMIATPLAYQPRYSFALYCSLPLICLTGMEAIKERKKNEK